MGCPSGILPLEFSPWQSMIALTYLFENFFVVNQTLGPYSRGQDRLFEPLVASIAPKMRSLEQFSGNSSFLIQASRFCHLVHGKKSAAILFLGTLTPTRGSRQLRETIYEYIAQFGAKKIGV